MENHDAMYIVGAIVLMTVIGFTALGFDKANISGDAIITNRCTDSDGGRNYNVSGTVIVSGSTPSVNLDICTGTIALKEYYCSLNRYKQSTLYNCPRGCQNGKCNR